MLELHFVYPAFPLYVQSSFFVILLFSTPA